MKALKSRELSPEEVETLRDVRNKRNSLLEYVIGLPTTDEMIKVTNVQSAYAASLHKVVKNVKEYYLYHILAGSTPHSPCENFDFPEPIISVREFVDEWYLPYNDRVEMWKNSKNKA